MARERIAIRPHYTNNAKNRIECEIHYPRENRKYRAVINQTGENGKGVNPDWEWIMNTVGPEGVEKHTRDFVNALKNQQSRDRQLKERDEGEALFNLKLEIFELPEVRESKNTKLKSKIRRATTPIQAQTFAAALIAYEQIKAEEPAPEPVKETPKPKKRASRKTVKKPKLSEGRVINETTGKVTIVDTLNDDKREK